MPEERELGGLVPRPDPTLLTTAALNREVSYLRSLLEAQVDNSREMAGALRDADLKFEDERDRRLTEVAAERDRRLTEVATEREKALKIKEEADKEALRLDREIRQFKDIATGARQDAAVAALEQRLGPIDQYVAGQRGEQSGTTQERRRREVTFGQIVGLAMAVFVFLSVLIGAAALLIHG